VNCSTPDSAPVPVSAFSGVASAAHASARSNSARYAPVSLPRRFAAFV